VNKKILCDVCYTSQPSDLFSIKYCSSSVIHKVCNTCVYQHIVLILDSCLLNSVPCPQFNCRAIISPSVICDILLKYNNNNLLNNYLREQHWQGTNEEWIKRFTLQCPGCGVPIQKSGGCNRMTCSRCKKDFGWLQSNRTYANRAVFDWEDIYVIIGFTSVALTFLFCVLYSKLN